MRSGQPLNDDDRQPWLAALHNLLEETLRRGDGIVLACSALRAVYREALLPRSAALVYLRITPEIVRERLRLGPAHYMPVSLVESQFATREEPENAIVVDASRPLEDVVAEAPGELG
jgi:gluconokinase